MGRIIPYIMENKKCLKPRIRLISSKKIEVIFKPSKKHTKTTENHNPMGFRHFSMKKTPFVKAWPASSPAPQTSPSSPSPWHLPPPGGRPGDRCGDRCRDGAAPVIWTGIHGMDGFDWENHGDIDGNMVNIAIMVNMIGLI